MLVIQYQDKKTQISWIICR